jgi:TolB-like protein
MKKFRLVLIGAFGLFAPDGRRIEITSRKAVALIALLATSPSGERSRAWLQAMLWGSREAAQAQSSLRREISTLARVLAAAGAGELLLRTNQRVGLAMNMIDSDIYSLGLLLPTGVRHVAGEFLEGLDLKDCEEFEDWLREERDRVRDMLELEIPPPAAPLPTARDILGGDPPDARELLAQTPLRLPPKPSVAVLPFEDLSPGTQGMVGIGIADEIGVILSQFPQLFAVASASARALVRQDLTQREIAYRLGVRYLLNGTVMQSGERLRVSVSLIEGQTGEQVWAETFGGRMDDLFEMQNEIASRIAPQIWTKVDLSERRRGLRVTGPAMGDYETYWHANALFRSWEKEPVLKAIALSEQLVEADPTCPWASSLAGFCNAIAFALGYAEDRDESLRRAVLHYQSAMRYGEDNVEALGYCAGILLFVGADLEVADRIILHALDILPSHQPTLFWGGWVDVFRGNPAQARERFELALRINPASGVRAQTLCGIGFAALGEGDPEGARGFFLEAAQIGPSFIPSHLGLAIASMLTGDASTARSAAAILGRADASLDFVSLFRQPEHRKLFDDALRQIAGLSELPIADLGKNVATFALPGI